MSTSTSSSSPAVRAVRTALAVSGAISLIVGLLILLWPGRTAEVAVGIIAVYVIIAGLVNIGIGIFFRSGWARIGYIVLGLLFIVAGIFSFGNLAATTAWFGVFVGTLVGILWIIEGVVSLTTLGDGSSKAWTIFFAIISILAGVVLLFSPLLGAVTLFILIGASLVVLGVFQIVRAIRF
ncbi:HdeD family acid-resistance protein, partial [Microbacterium sp.]|uniref:HdeD family acid-resistance protein n=1 Tax=Microbacterium sp. TaxID=51671 RepID=UPI0037C969FB